MNATLHPGGTVALAAVWLFALHAMVQAQNNPPPAPAPAEAPAKTEMQRWIEATDAQWQAAFKRDVADVREAELAKVKLQYMTALDDGIKRASSANDLQGALALRNEQKRFADTQTFPEKDEDAGAPALTAVRAALRVELGQLESRHAGRAKALHAKYDPYLAQMQAQLTKAQRLDDALLVQTKRDEVAAAWLTPAIAAAAGKENPPAPGTPATGVQKPAPPPKVPFGTKAGPVLAKVEAAGTVRKPFAKGEIAFSNRAYVFTEVPAALDGWQFTQAPMGGPPLSFKVVSDGLVQMACTSRFAQKKSSGWESEVTTEKMLQQNGWHKERDLDFATTDPSYGWSVYTRQCKAGEQFTIRTEKYATPILLVK